MRAVIQRVKSASVAVGGERTAQISSGLLALVGVEEGDGERDVEYTASKIVGLRVFADDDGKMNLDVKAAGASLLVVSQFTLMGDARKGRRPSFTSAERPEKAAQIFEDLIQRLCRDGIGVSTGRFQEHMEVELVNDGPVTILLDSRKKF